MRPEAGGSAATAPARRPWWRKKRWAAAGVLWLVVAYPLSFGPVLCLMDTGRIPRQAFPAVRVVYRPYLWACSENPLRWAASAYNGVWVRPVQEPPTVRPAQLPRRPLLAPVGELPRLTPEPDAGGVPVDAADLPPLPTL